MSVPSDPTLPSLPPRPSDAHKGTFGTALIIGGSRGMTGAVALAGMAAGRGGAGLVRLAVADRCLETVAGYEPSYMTAALPDDVDGRISGRGPCADCRVGPFGDRRCDRAGLGTFARLGSSRRAALPRAGVADGLRRRRLERVVDEAGVVLPACRAAAC